MRTIFTLGALAAVAFPLAGCAHEHHHERAACALLPPPPPRVVYRHDECVRDYHAGYYAPPPVVYYRAPVYRVYPAAPPPRYGGPGHDHHD